MPLETNKLKKILEYAFWIGIFVIAYILMQKAMHPGWTFFGI
ncbi:MAG: hypothetical protein Q7S21_01835 [archaeon]|nr:hypothetical protein [archaeon]